MTSSTAGAGWRRGRSAAAALLLVSGAVAAARAALVTPPAAPAATTATAAGCGSRPAPAAHGPAGPLVAVERDRRSSEAVALVHVRPRDGIVARPRLLLDGPLWEVARSPSGRRLAVMEGLSRLRVVEAATLTAGRRIALPGAIRRTTLVWAGERRLVAFRDDRGVVRSFVVDLRRGTVTRPRATAGQLLVARPTADGAVALLAPASGVGGTRVVHVDERGRVRASLPVPIDGGDIRSPTASPRSSVVPALAVHPSSSCALVVGAGSRVAVVRLDTMAATVSTTTARRSVVARLREALDPVADAKGPAATVRHAVWTDGATVAVWGEDAERAPGGRPAFGTRPAGLVLVDARTWTRRTVERSASAASVAASGRLVAVGGPEDHTRAARRRGIGVRVYDAGGRRLHHRLGTHNARSVVTWGTSAYVEGPRGALVRVDLATGRASTLRGTAGRVELLDG